MGGNVDFSGGKALRRSAARRCSATAKTAVWAGVSYLCTRKAEISGPAQLPGSGAGNRVHRSVTAIRSPSTLLPLLVRPKMGICSLGTTYGLKHFAGGKIVAAPLAHRRAGCPSLAGCCGIATAACGSAPTAAGFCTFTREGPMCSHERMASRPIQSTTCLRIGREISGLRRLAEWTAFGISPSPLCPSKQGLAGDFVTAVLASRDGSVWMSGSGLSRWSNGQVASIGNHDGLPDAAPQGLLRR